MTDEILIRFSVKDDGSPVIEKVNQKLGETTKQSKALVPGLESARESLTGFVGQNAALIGVLVGVGVALKKGFDDYNAYIDVVRETSRSLGIASDEAGRLIQVADDVGISVDALKVSMKMAQKDGINPNIDGLAKMSDEYLSLAPGVDRAQFLLDKFGRSGEQMGKLMDLGSAAIKRQAAAVEASLAPTEKAIEEQRKYEIAVDALGDSWTALTYKVMPAAVTAMTAVTNKLRDNAEAGKLAEEAGWGLLGNLYLVKLGFLEQAAANREAADANLTAKKAAEDAGGAFLSEADQAKVAADAIKEISDAIEFQISAIDKIQSIENDYTEKSKALMQERGDAEIELAALRAQGYSEQSEQIQGALIKLDEIKAKEDELTAQKAEQTLQFEADMLRQTLARDGWTVGEDEAFQKQMIAWGLWSQDSVDKANAVIERAQATAAAIDAIPSEKTSTIYINTVITGSNSVSANENVANIPHAGGGTFTLPYHGNESYMLPGGNTVSGGEPITIGKAGTASRTDELLSALLEKKMIDEGLLARRIVNALKAGGG